MKSPRQYRYIDLARYIKANAPDVVEGVTELQLCDDLEGCFMKKVCFAYYYVSPSGELGGVLTGYYVSPIIVHISLLISTHPFAMFEMAKWANSNIPEQTIRCFRRKRLIYYPSAQRLFKQLEKQQLQ